MRGLLIELLLAILLTSQAHGFFVRQNNLPSCAGYHSRLQDFSHGLSIGAPSAASSSSSLSMANNNDDGKTDDKDSPNLFTLKNARKFRGTIIVGLLAIQAVVNLVTRELPPILSGQPEADYFGAILDTVFFGWAGTNFLLQTGILADSIDGDEEGISLDGLECRITVDVGREPGTWMDKNWASSGARLVLPVNVRFTNEKVDLGIPGEAALGGRYCRKLEVLDNVFFVGPNGQVEVPVTNGGWSTLPIIERKVENGERALRFFLDFPTGAERNDVSIPSGRVFFSSAVLPADAAPNNPVAVLAPDGAGILPEGGVTIKSDGGIVNLWGAMGELNLILGRYSVRAAR